MFEDGGGEFKTRVSMCNMRITSVKLDLYCLLKYLKKIKVYIVANQNQISRLYSSVSILEIKFYSLH